MSSTQAAAQSPRAQTPRIQNNAPAAAEQWQDIEIGTPQALPRATQVPARPANRPAPTVPAAPRPSSDKVVDPHSWWWTGSMTVLGLIIGGIAAGVYARSQASKRDHEGFDCWDDDDGNRHCPPQGDDTTHASIIAVSLVLPTVGLAALTIGFRLVAGAWTISRAALKEREARDAESYRSGGTGRTYYPNAGALAQQQQMQQAWNQGVLSDRQAMGNGQITSGFLPTPFSF